MEQGNSVKCLNHAEISDDYDSYIYLKQYWVEVENSMNDIERDWIKAQVIHSLFEKIKGHTNAKQAEEVKEEYIKIERIVNEQATKISNLPTSCELNAFRNIKKAKSTIRDLKNRFFQKFGLILVDLMALNFLSNMYSESSSCNMMYSSSVGVPKILYGQEYNFAIMLGDICKNLDSYEDDIKSFYNNQIYSVAEQERIRFSSVIQEESEKWIDQQDTMLSRHQDFLYYLRDYYSWGVRKEVDQYLQKFRCGRRTW